MPRTTSTAEDAGLDLGEDTQTAPVAAEPAASVEAFAAEPASEDLVDAVVARGVVVVGTFADPEEVGPGGTVRLPRKEVARLRADGVLEDPNAQPLPEWQGPSVGRG